MIKKDKFYKIAGGTSDHGYKPGEVVKVLGDYSGEYYVTNENDILKSYVYSDDLGEEVKGWEGK